MEGTMEVTTTHFKHCVLVKVNGRIDSFTAPQLQSAFTELVDSKNYKVVFDMQVVEFMSSAGLRVMMSAQKACKRHNRVELVLCCVPVRIIEAMELAGFLPLFKIFNDSTQAVGYF